MAPLLAEATSLKSMSIATVIVIDRLGLRWALVVAVDQIDVALLRALLQPRSSVSSGWR